MDIKTPVDLNMIQKYAKKKGGEQSWFYDYVTEKNRVKFDN